MNAFNSLLLEPSPLEKMLQAEVQRFRLPNLAERQSNRPDDDWPGVMYYATIFGEVLPERLLDLIRLRGGFAEIASRMLEKQITLHRIELLAEFYSHLEHLQHRGTGSTVHDETRNHWIRQTLASYQYGNAFLLYAFLYGLQVDIGIKWILHIADTWGIEAGRAYVETFDPGVHDIGDIGDMLGLAESNLGPEVTISDPFLPEGAVPLCVRDASVMFSWCFPKALSR